MTLIEYVQFKLNESGADAKITSDEIEMYLAKHRFLNPVAVANAFRSILDSSTEIDTDTAQVTITLRDIYGTYQYYCGVYGAFICPDGMTVMADDVELGSGEYTYDEVKCELVMTPALADEATVQIKGHLVNIDGPFGVMYDCIGVLIGHVSKLANTRGQEFKDLRRNMKLWQREFASGVSHVRR